MTLSNAERELLILIGIICLAALAMFVIGRLSGPVTNPFIDACVQVGGKPAFDGRQWQCLKATAGASQP